MPTKAAETWLRRCFQSLLVIITAKAQCAVGPALSQLLTYLACLCQSWLQRRRTDASVYGIASDGYIFIFVKIAHNGTVMTSKYFDIQCGEMLEVLGFLEYIWETTVNMSPNIMPENGGGGEKDADDPVIDLQDNDYINEPEDDDVD
jgi:hypothetical protein